MKERFIAALAARGSQIVPSRSKKYVCMTRTDRPGAKTFYWIGKSGAVRFGAVATRTYPVSEEFKRKLLAGEAVTIAYPESRDTELRQNRQAGEVRNDD